MPFDAEVTGTVQSGRFVLRVGARGGTRAYFRPDFAADSTDLRVALSQPFAGPGAGGLADAEEALAEAGSVTGQVERSLELFTELAQGRILDRAVFLKEVDALLGALERLDRQGRHRDTLRLARALASVLALAMRWVALVETLRTALRAADALGDISGIAWARHELGTLALGTDDGAAANSQLKSALQQREQIGDQDGVAATRHNLNELEGVFGAPDGGGGWSKPLIVTAIIAGVLLVVAVGAGIAILRDGDDTPAVDTEPPKTEIVSGPDDPTEETSAAFEFEANETVKTFECRLDEASFQECVSPANVLGPLDPGKHVFAVRATDLAGNRGDPATYEWRIEEGTKPTVTILDGPPELTNDPVARFSLLVPGGAQIECRVDDGDFQGCSTTPRFEVDEGDHTFAARALDQSGDPGPEATYRWTVDTTGPTVTIDDDVKTTPEAIEITFEPSESGSTTDCVLFQQTDSGLAQLQSVPNCTSPVILQAAQGAKYVVRITATDPAGNKGEPAEKEVDRAVD